MFAGERRRIILETVRANGAVALKDLAALVGTSQVTVRRDLSALQNQGLLDRFHGGAVFHDGFTHEASHVEKTRQAREEKSAIGALAAELVDEGDAIAIGPGTTTHALARCLSTRRDLTVMTNSLLVAQALARSPGVDVVVTGGSLRGSIHALVGSTAEQTLAGIRTRTAFLSGNGLSPEHGLSTPNLLVAGVDRALVASAQRVVVMVDSTKIGVDTMVRTADIDRIDDLVTDDGTPVEVLEDFRERGVRVHVAATGTVPPEWSAENSSGEGERPAPLVAD